MPQVPDVGHELFARCEKYMRWIKREGLELDSLQAAADFSGDLVRVAQELHEFLEDELKRQRPPKSS